MNGTLQQTDAVVQIPVEKISPNPHQPRKTFDEIRLQELADSIREHGVQQAIVVRVLNEDDGTYEIVMGERRLRACKLLGLETIPAVIREGMADEVSRELALIENVQREDLTPIEEAQSYSELAEIYDNDLQKVAARVSKSQPHIEGRIALLNLPQEVQDLIDQGKINLEQAKVILELEPDVQIEAANRVIRLNLTANELRGRMQHFLKKNGSDGGGRKGSQAGSTTYNQLTAIVVRLYEGLSGYDFGLLGDQNKRTTLRKQLTLIRQSVDQAIEKLEQEPSTSTESAGSEDQRQTQHQAA